MSTVVDEQVKGWLKRKFLESRSYHPETQGAAEHIEVVKADASWECGCYSEYTRDDSFVFEAVLKDSNGREFTWQYGYWANLPDFVHELDEYINGNGCRYDDEDEGWN